MITILLLVCCFIAGGWADTELISQDKPARQSSTISNYHAGLAVDGKREQHYSLASCSATNRQNRPWWSVDLMGRYRIVALTIYNRQSSGQHLKDFDVLTRDAKTKKYTRCARHHGSSRSREIIVLDCEADNVDHVMIKSRSNTYLILCEVLIFGERETRNDEPKEVGHDMEAHQSSNYRNYYAGLALDLNPSSRFGDRSCACTASQNNPWWMVNLGHRYKLHRVVIYNRNAAASRLGNFVVESSNSRNGRWRTCAYVRRNAKPREIFNLKCKSGSKGAYVRIRMRKRNYLTLCDVRIYALRDFKGHQKTNPEHS